MRVSNIFQNMFKRNRLNTFFKVVNYQMNQVIKQIDAFYHCFRTFLFCFNFFRNSVFFKTYPLSLQNHKCIYPKLRSLKINQLKCCNFPVITVTNYHKFTVQEQHMFIILQFWTSEVQHESYRYKNRGVRMAGSFWRFQGEFIPSLFYFLQVAYILWLRAFLLQTSCLLPSSFGTCDYIRPTWVIQDNLSISKSLA